ncbi:hypothetical protein AB0E83_27605 [Streptomyces sp. NPDC035033]|uniref:hypothetical protein n=1 Tax=Streptomyces sp. NPDC035033 TaxID=3155368 RepID=UPI0033FA761E
MRALGTWARVEYELHGTLPMSAYGAYGFKAPKPSQRRPSGIYRQVGEAHRGKP